jgi:hypothetical protein
VYAATRLDSIASRFPEFSRDLRVAHDYVPSDTHITFAKLRLILEQVVRAYAMKLTAQPVPEDTSLQVLLDEEHIRSSVPANTLTAIHRVRIQANRAIHGATLSGAEAAEAMERMLDVLDWCSTWWRSIGKVSQSLSSTSVSFRRDPSPLSPRSVTRSPKSPATGIAVGVGCVVLFCAALIWLYLANLDGLMNQQQKNWVERTRPPSPPQPSRPAYVRNYPASWPAPFFQEEIMPGAWGAWLDEPYWRHGGTRPGSYNDRDFIWYRPGEANGVQAGNEWAIQCEDSDGTVRDVPAGHNEECEFSHRIRIRNDWHAPALVYYFAKNY